MKSLLKSTLSDNTHLNYSQESDDSEKKHYEFPLEKFSVADAWSNLTDLFEKMYPEAAEKFLNEGATEAEIEKLSEKIGVDIPAQLKDSLEIQNGSEGDTLHIGNPYHYTQKAKEYDAGGYRAKAAGLDEDKRKKVNGIIRKKLQEKGITPGYLADTSLLSTEQIIQQYKHLRSHAEDEDFQWDTSWIPVGVHADDEYLFIDENGMVHWVDVKDPDGRVHPMTNDFAEWLSWSVHALEIAIDAIDEVKDD